MGSPLEDKEVCIGVGPLRFQVWLNRDGTDFSLVQLVYQWNHFALLQQDTLGRESNIRRDGLQVKNSSARKVILPEQVTQCRSSVFQTGAALCTGLPLYFPFTGLIYFELSSKELTSKLKSLEYPGKNQERLADDLST